MQNELSRSRNSSSHSLNNISPHRHNNINTENHLNSSFTLLQENKNKKDKLGSSNHFLIVIVILLLSIVLLYIKFDSDPVTVKYEYDRFQFDNDVKDLKEKYKIEDNSILQVKTGEFLNNFFDYYIIFQTTILITHTRNTKAMLND